MHTVLVIVIFVFTLGLVLVRPRGLNEAWATVIGASLMLLCRQVTVAQAVNTVLRGADVLLFLLGLLVLSHLLFESGFFDWASIQAARSATGNGKVLFRNVFVLGAITTALLSLDTTAVILTPIVVTCVKRLNFPPLPFLLACAFVANSGSQLLPISNLTNLLFVSAYHWNFVNFALTMALPELSVLVLNYFMLVIIFNPQIPSTFNVSDLSEAISAVPNLPYFICAVVTLILVLVGYFAGPRLGVAPYVVALTGAAALLALGIALKRTCFKALGNISWSVFPFVIGLFVVVQGVENIGLTRIFAGLVVACGSSALAQAFGSVFAASIGSNIVNNIPMALLSISALDHAPSITKYGALIGCDIGPNLTIAGSLATILVISSARRHGEVVRAYDFFKAGVVITPILLSAAAISLWLVCR